MKNHFCTFLLIAHLKFNILWLIYENFNLDTFDSVQVNFDAQIFVTLK